MRNITYFNQLFCLIATLVYTNFTFLYFKNIFTIKQNTVIIIVGATAVGKTNFAIKLAQQYNTQIISADSRQCFNELNIGVAKPSNDELNLVHHYFINSHSIHQPVNAGVYEQYALAAAQKIFKHNNIAIMVGGTGLYVNTFCNGIDEMPTISTEVRNNITHQYNQLGLDWLQNEVKNKDFQFWQTAEQQNPQRLLRALEIVETTGNSITFYKTKKRVERDFNIVKIGLELPKQELYNRINQRVDTMVEQGLVNEVEHLQPYKQLNALQTVGYKELFHFFDNNTTLQDAIEKIKINTRHYAKRQMTWFKKDVEINWMHPNEQFEL